MKRVVLSLLCVTGFGAASLAQQVPNNGFETWSTTPGTTVEKPQNWLTTDDALTSLFGPTTTNTVSKSTDKQSGSFAVRLETKAAVLPLFPIPVTVPGTVVLGNSINGNQVTDQAGLPYTGRPTAMSCFYKLTGNNLAADSAYIGVQLTRTSNGQTVTVGEGVQVLRQAAASYTALTIPIQYTSPQAPDSIHIILASGNFSRLGLLTAGNALLVDNITLGTISAARDVVAAPALTVYPNPSANGQFTLDAARQPALLQAALAVTDVTGRTVLTQPALARPAASRRVDLHSQPAGVYTLRLATDQGPVVRRLVVR